MSKYIYGKKGYKTSRNVSYLLQRMDNMGESFTHVYNQGWIRLDKPTHSAWVLTERGKRKLQSLRHKT